MEIYRDMYAIFGLEIIDIPHEEQTRVNRNENLIIFLSIPAIICHIYLLDENVPTNSFIFVSRISQMFCLSILCLTETYNKVYGKKLQKLFNRAFNGLLLILGIK